MKNRDAAIAETQLQLEYIEKIKGINADFERKSGRKKKMMIVTFGCQMNAHDSEKLKGMLEEMDFVETFSEKEADFIIYNTCCVRENAENRVYGNLGYLKHAKAANPELRIAVCGCMTQQDVVLETIRKSYRHVDIVFGTFNFYKLPELMLTNIETNSPVYDIWKEHGEIVEDLPCVRAKKHKASVNIMFGCNNFCSYCIVPYVRGRERSRLSEDILNEVRLLAEDGVKEVTLLGQNVNSYGKGLDENISFAELLRMVSEVEGIERIRFMTSHPKDLSDELIYEMRDNEKICKHIHLPFQAGNNAILEKMNRKYTKEAYLELIGKIKREIPEIAITTDIIVGFPGETAKEVEDTIDVINQVEFDSGFTFIYSKRTGTPAANMPNPLSEAQIKENFNKVLEALNATVLKNNQSRVGKVFSVLVDDVSDNDSTLVTGRLEDNSLVHFKGDSSLIGEIVKVKIVDCKTFYLIGERID